MNNLGRPNLGRTATLKSRSAYVYMPTKVLLAECKRRAKCRKISLSQYIVMCIKEHISHEKAKAFSDMMDECDFDD